MSHMTATRKQYVDSTLLSERNVRGKTETDTNQSVIKWSSQMKKTS